MSQQIVAVLLNQINMTINPKGAVLVFDSHKVGDVLDCSIQIRTKRNLIYYKILHIQRNILWNIMWNIQVCIIKWFNSVIRDWCESDAASVNTVTLITCNLYLCRKGNVSALKAMMKMLRCLRQKGWVQPSRALRRAGNHGSLRYDMHSTTRHQAAVTLDFE